MPAESYIVRIYRRGRAGEITGQVERVKDTWRRAFRNLAELNAILASGAAAGTPEDPRPGAPDKETAD